MKKRLPRLALFTFSFAIGLNAAAFAQATTSQLGIPITYPASSSKGAQMRPLPDTFGNQSHPAATPSPAPGHIGVSARLRSYYFRRINAVPNPANPNRDALETAAQVHLDYRFANTPLNVGYTYFAAAPIGDDPNPIANPHIDNSLPGYSLSSLAHEAYLQYRDANNSITIGNQELNLPWLPNSDSRVQPESYQGLDSTFKVTNDLSFSLTRVIRFEHRNVFTFQPNSLLTVQYPGNSPPQLHPFTPGTLRLALNYHPTPRLVVAAEDDEFYNIANMVYAEAKYGLGPYSVANPYLAVQYVAEGSLGTNQIGTVDNHTLGAQLGATLARGLLVTASADTAPWKYAFVNAPTAAAAASGYFVGVGGTGVSTLVSPGLYKVAYGGIASPFTDSLGTDPLYTSQISQAAVDRRSAGTSYKVAFVYTTPDRQLKLIADEAWFQYSNDISRNLTSEFNADATYFFRKIRPGPYRGLLARIRIAPRIQPTLPFGFDYERFQTEYDF